jgi:hypothetical protein
MGNDVSVTLAMDIEPRTYFRSFESALADFRPPAENIDQIVDVVRGLDFEHVYIPDSRAFIALEPGDGGTPVAYISHGYIAVHPRDRENFWVELPSHQLRAKGFVDVAREVEAAVRSAEPVAATCPDCYTNLPATGRCDYCY